MSLIFFKQFYKTFWLIQLIFFKIGPLSVNTPLVAVLPLQETFFKLIRRNRVQFDCHSFVDRLDGVETPPLQLSFQAREQEEVRRGQVWAVGRVGKHRNPHLGQCRGAEEGGVRRRIVVMKGPIFDEVGPNPGDAVFQPKEHFFVKCRVYSASWRYKLLVDDASRVEKDDQHGFDLGFRHARLLGSWRLARVPLRTLSLALRIVLKAPGFISCDTIV